MRGHRGMGIRSQRKTELAAGCRGMGSRPVRLTTPRYDPLVVTLHCTSVYVQGVVAANRETLREASIGPRKQKPRASGALTGATEGLGELEAARRQGSNDGAATSFRSKIQNSPSAGRSRHPSALAPHSAAPGPHRYSHTLYVENGGKAEAPRLIHTCSSSSRHAAVSLKCDVSDLARDTVLFLNGFWTVVTAWVRQSCRNRICGSGRRPLKTGQSRNLGHRAAAKEPRPW